MANSEGCNNRHSVGLLLFPIALMLTQVIDEFGISFSWYITALVALAVVYVLYVVKGEIKAVKSQRRQEIANQRIQSEVNRGAS